MDTVNKYSFLLEWIRKDTGKMTILLLNATNIDTYKTKQKQYT